MMFAKPARSTGNIAKLVAGIEKPAALVSAEIAIATLDREAVERQADIFELEQQLDLGAFKRPKVSDEQLAEATERLARLKADITRAAKQRIAIERSAAPARAAYARDVAGVLAAVRSEAAKLYADGLNSAIAAHETWTAASAAIEKAGGVSRHRLALIPFAHNFVQEATTLAREVIADAELVATIETGQHQP